ncbi:unnamed protein product [Mytilus coruscus]|uniref:Uncharacterized protein n=1 Tax=Mytilus coruscus TaxID=42192 RepID=A0A6J8E2K3_MYTCO|nr:unnamed protein product [Mytilus coruscus]
MFLKLLTTCNILVSGLGIALNLTKLTDELNSTAWSINLKTTEQFGLMGILFKPTEIMKGFERMDNWNSSCNILQKENSTLRIFCLVHGGANLKFSEFRNFAARLSSSYLIDLNVICVGGYVRFPWPFRAHKLKRIYIKDCVIREFRREFKDKTIDRIPDALQHVQIENATKIVTMKELAESLPKSYSPITRAAECGPENAKIIIQRGISIEIEEDPDEWKQFNRNTYYNHYFNTQKRTCILIILKRLK